MKAKLPKPRKIHIDVTENGNKTADVRLPYGMFKLGMKYGGQAAKKETDSCARAMAHLDDFDCAAFECSVAAGEILLPYELLNLDEPDSRTHVTITVE